MDGFPIWWADFRTNMPVPWQTDETGTDFHRATMAWVASLGFDPDHIGAAVAVVPWQGQYELHLDEIVPTPGRPGVDRNDPLDQDKVLSIRRIIEVDKDSWPARPEAMVA